MKNKKGMIAENMSEVGVAAIIIIIAIVLLSIASKLNETGRKENSQDEMLNALFENNVGLYLKQPVELLDYPDQLITMADLTVMAAENPDKEITHNPKKTYKDLWTEKTNDFFTTTNNLRFDKLEVKVLLGEGGTQVFSWNFGSSGPNKGALFSVSSKVTLPSYSGKIVTIETNAETQYTVSIHGGNLAVVQKNDQPIQK